MAQSPDYLFLHLLEKYVHRVVDKCDIVTIAVERTVSQIDLSGLSSVDQKGFVNWLNKSFYIRISIDNALRRNLGIKAISTRNTRTGNVDYSVRIV